MITSFDGVPCCIFFHLNRQVFYSLINNLSTIGRTIGTMTIRLENTTIQLFNQDVIYNLKNVLTKPAMLRTETPDTTQDMQTETKNINAICPYLAGVMPTLLMFVRS